MEFRSDLHSIFLVIFHLINVGGESTDDGDEKSLKGENHKWTLDEEAKLIFFDVLTNTGEKNHFGRIRNEWRREYPESNITNDGLRCKLYRLRLESLEEGEVKRKYKWNQELNRELLDICQTTYPYRKDANISLEEEWSKRHPHFQMSRKYLLERVRNLQKKSSYSEYGVRVSNEASSHVENEGTEGELRHQWTKNEEAKLLHFDELTDPREPKHSERLRLKWREEFPESKVTDTALLMKLHKLRCKSQRGIYEKYLKWSPEEEKMLLDIYFNTYPYRKDVIITLEDEWKRRHPGHQSPRKYLLERARRIMRENKYPEYRAQELSNTNSQSGNRHDIEVLRAKKFENRVMKRSSASSNMEFQLNNRDSPRLLSSRRFESGEKSGLSLAEMGEGSRTESLRKESMRRRKFIPGMKSLEGPSGGLNARERGKRSGKAPMVYTLDESALSPPGMMSEDSE